MAVLMTLAIVVGVCVDLFSCCMELKKNRGLSNSSGLFGVTLITCYLLPIVISTRPILTASAWLDAGIFVVFHFGVLVLIPWLDRFLLRRQ